MCVCVSVGNVVLVCARECAYSEIGKETVGICLCLGTRLCASVASICGRVCVRI